MCRTLTGHDHIKVFSSRFLNRAVRLVPLILQGTTRTPNMTLTRSHEVKKRGKSSRCVLLFIEEQVIMQMSGKPRENLPSPRSENFCQKARKKRATTFVRHASKRGSTAQSACSGYLRQASGDLATTFLPSRLSRVRVPSPTLLFTSSLSWPVRSRLVTIRQ
jgi:hypothetical protein